jgi:hypothetical protein
VGLVKKPEDSRISLIAENQGGIKTGWILEQASLWIEKIPIRKYNDIQTGRLSIPVRSLYLRQGIKQDMTNLRDLLAQNMKVYRCSLGLSQVKLAERVSTSTHYYRYDRDLKQVSITRNA